MAPKVLALGKNNDMYMYMIYTHMYMCIYLHICKIYVCMSSYTNSEKCSEEMNRAWRRSQFGFTKPPTYLIEKESSSLVLINLFSVS